MTGRFVLNKLMPLVMVIFTKIRVCSTISCKPGQTHRTHTGDKAYQCHILITLFYVNHCLKKYNMAKPLKWFPGPNIVLLVGFCKKA